LGGAQASIDPCASMRWSTSLISITPGIIFLPSMSPILPLRSALR
jgi:hypothetical protein